MYNNDPFRLILYKNNPEHYANGHFFIIPVQTE